MAMEIRMTQQLPLSQREKEILTELIKGQLNKEIAYTLCISTETVKKHVRNIYKKLSVRNRAEAIFYSTMQKRA